MAAPVYLELAQRAKVQNATSIGGKNLVVGSRFTMNAKQVAIVGGIGIGVAFLIVLKARMEYEAGLLELEQAKQRTEARCELIRAGGDALGKIAQGTVKGVVEAFS